MNKLDLVNSIKDLNETKSDKNHTHSLVTTVTDGMMSSEDKSKLDNIEIKIKTSDLNVSHNKTFIPLITINISPTANIQESFIGHVLLKRCNNNHSARILNISLGRAYNSAHNILGCFYGNVRTGTGAVETPDGYISYSYREAIVPATATMNGIAYGGIILNSSAPYTQIQVNNMSGFLNTCKQEPTVYLQHSINGDIIVNKEIHDSIFESKWYSNTGGVERDQVFVFNGKKIINEDDLILTNSIEEELLALEME